MQKIKLTIAYDGTDFHGFQVQTGHEPPLRTVQGVLQDTLRAVMKAPVFVTGAGRTDAGVHAYGQVVTFEVDGAIPVERWTRLLNHRLPRDIVARSAEAVPSSFHPRYDAMRKVYRYTIETAEIPDVFARRFYTHFTQSLNTEAMQRAAQYLAGTHDFTSFSAAGAQVKDRVRTLESVGITTEGTRIHFRYTGQGFLQHMVRILTGTLVDVGRGVIAVEDVPRILLAKDRRAAGPTMPPEGLTLQEVIYKGIHDSSLRA